MSFMGGTLSMAFFQEHFTRKLLPYFVSKNIGGDQKTFLELIFLNFLIGLLVNLTRIRKLHLYENMGTFKIYLMLHQF